MAAAPGQVHIGCDGARLHAAEPRPARSAFLAGRRRALPLAAIGANLSCTSRAQRSAAEASRKASKNNSRGALQTRDRSGLWRSRISGAPRAHLSVTG